MASFKVEMWWCGKQRPVTREMRPRAANRRSLRGRLNTKYENLLRSVWESGLEMCVSVTFIRAACTGPRLVWIALGEFCLVFEFCSNYWNANSIWFPQCSWICGMSHNTSFFDLFFDKILNNFFLTNAKQDTCCLIMLEIELFQVFLVLIF